MKQRVEPYKPTPTPTQKTTSENKPNAPHLSLKHPTDNLICFTHSTMPQPSRVPALQSHYSTVTVPPRSPAVLPSSPQPPLVPLQVLFYLFFFLSISIVHHHPPFLISFSLFLH
ncbi:hypothetical protein V8G54_014152 [Vigna mungo]|uniref:Uncharacterized protein n=1 Tax=Vigna mungo TaxID=3915 RepID=A0AAQ3NJ19_VIGMU